MFSSKGFLLVVVITACVVLSVTGFRVDEDRRAATSKVRALETFELRSEAFFGGHFFTLAKAIQQQGGVICDTLFPNFTTAASA